MRLLLTLSIFQLFYFFTNQQELDIDDSQLGFVGNYAGISKYQSNLQFETINDISALVQQGENNIFEKLSIFDGNITSTCTIQDDIYIGGYFTTVNRTLSMQHVVKYNTQSNQFQPLDQGLDGPVYTLFCDQVDQILYVGGNFSLYVAQWSLTNHSWSPLPWKGFNGPVYTITKNTKYNTLLFGGQFDATGDGQLFNSNTSQLVPMSSPTSISSGNGIGDPTNIVCPLQGDPWYLQDGVPGYWDANFVNPIEPTVFRLSNTHTDRGTLTFNVLALGSNEYFELSYVDPVTQQIMQCSEDCILSNATFQDFTVLVPKSTNGIRININDWYGTGGGLGYVQIFQSDISVNPHLYANQDSQCNPTASSTQTLISGNWEDVYVYGYYQTILQANTQYSTLSTSNIGITYQPNIPAQGQYDIYATTPGCVGSANCFSRTQVEYELVLSPGFPPTTVVLDQNTFSDKKTLLYSGFISPVTNEFKPTIRLKPAANATQPTNGGDNVSIMADSIELVRNTTSASLVSILEYNPKIEQTRSWKPLNQQLPLGSAVYSIDATNGDILYIGGLFSDVGARNIISYDTNQGRFVALDNFGLNGQVNKVLLNDNSLYVAGEFNATETIDALHVVEYNVQKRTWNTLGNGVDGPATQLSLSSGILSVSGNFHHYHPRPTESKLSIGNALWNTSNRSWTDRTSLIVGNLALDSQRYFAGNILGAQTYRADLITSTHLSSKTIFNRSMIITAGVTWINNLTSIPITIIAGHPFEGNSLSTIYMYDNHTLSTIDHVRGTVNVLAVFQNRLFVGGQFTHPKNQTAASLVVYDLANKNQMLSVSGIYDADNNPGIVRVIKSHPDGKRVVVGGEFSRAGLFDCHSICVIDPVIRQWNQIAVGLNGNVFDVVTYTSQEKQKLLVVGDFVVASLEGQSWSYASDVQVPGTPKMAVHSIDDELIISGTSSLTSEVFIGSLNNGKYTSMDADFGKGTNISQILFVPVISTSIEQRFPSGTQNMLLAVGDLNLTEFGQSSAALYDGTKWHPYLLTTQINGKPGMIHQIVHTTNYDGIRGARKYLSVAAVVLISIAISTGILFAMSAISLLVLYKKHQNSLGPEEMPEWTPSNRFLETLGLFGTGTLAASTIAATSPKAKGEDSAVFAASTSRSLLSGPSQAIPRSTFQHEEVTVSPTTTIVNPLPPVRSTAAVTAVTAFSTMKSAAQSHHDGPISELNPKLYYAKYPFKAQEFGELSFEVGDAIVVTDTTDTIWWLGYKDDGTDKPTSGVFPSNYVQQ